MSQQAKISLTNEVLIPLTGICVILCLFLWQPGINKFLWLRRFFLYAAGLAALVALWIIRKQIKLPKYVVVTIGLILFFSTVGLLLNRPLSWALIGQPIVHPGLLSLYASVAVAMLLATYKYRDRLYITGYIAIVIFQLLNLVGWLINGVDDRLGFLGGQINYTAFLSVIGLTLGLWVLLRRKTNRLILLASQSLLLVSTMLAQSRVAIVLALAVSIAMITVLLRQKQIKAAGLVTILIIVMIAIGVYASSFNRLHSGQYLDTSLTYRLDIAKAAFPHRNSSLILGGGVGSLERNIGSNGRQYAPIAKDLKNGWRFESSHNYFVDLAVERGLIVLGLYIALISLALKAGFKSRDLSQKFAAYMLVVTVLFLAVNNINIQIEALLWIFIMASLVTPTAA